jgi:hypothetical protein
MGLRRFAQYDVEVQNVNAVYLTAALSCRGYINGDIAWL